MLILLFCIFSRISFQPFSFQPFSFQTFLSFYGPDRDPQLLPARQMLGDGFHLFLLLCGSKSKFILGLVLIFTCLLNMYLTHLKKKRCNLPHLIFHGVLINNVGLIYKFKKY